VLHSLQKDIHVHSETVPTSESGSETLIWKN